MIWSYVALAIVITAFLLAIIGVTSDVLTYRELQRKLRLEKESNH